MSIGTVVVTAEPGAGKSTILPLVMANAAAARTTTDRSGTGRVVVLEPRRLAARATAARLAELIGVAADRSDPLIGLTMRGEHRVGPSTRVEVVTEAVLTNRLQEDPELPGIDAVIFDEFHERNLHSDLSLAMALEVRATIRPDLMIMVMSATLDAEPIAALLGGDGPPAPLVEVPGRTHPVETYHLRRPSPRAWTAEVADATMRALDTVTGDVLVFVPGVGEIDRVRRAIDERFGSNDDRPELIGLHGGSRREVHQAVMTKSRRRRVIVATAVAETSITIPSIEAVVDGGRLRRAVFDPGSGLGRLETGHATTFAADQRRGRAGRLGPGVCFRLWSIEDHRLLDASAPPAIMDGDPVPVAFELARWGDPEARDLPLLDHPGTDRLASARRQLATLGLTDGVGVLTERGRLAATMPVDARLASLVIVGAELDRARMTAEVAGVLANDPRSRSTDLARLVERHRGDPAVRRTIDRCHRAIRSIDVTSDQPPELDHVLAVAWPDRVAMARPGRLGHFLLATGREVHVDTDDPLAGAPFLIVATADGIARAARVRTAVPTDRTTVLAACREHIEWRTVAEWDPQSKRIVAERRQQLGAITLHREPDPDPPADAIRDALGQAVRAEGLSVFRWSDRANELRDRLGWLHGEQPDRWPAVHDRALLDQLDDWLPLDRVRSLDQVRRIDVTAALLDRLGWQERATLDAMAPLELPLPNGGAVRVRYDTGRPVWAVRIQRLFGLDEHPTVGPHGSPVTIELLSPASRVAQTTIDLPGFWRGSYAEVRRDLRGRYPKHAWPEDPLE